MIGAGLFLQTIRNLRAIDLGFSAQNLVTFEVSFPRGTTAERIYQTHEQVRERLTARPGVLAVSCSWLGLYDGGGWSDAMETEERRAAPGEDNEVALMAVGPGFFATIGLALQVERIQDVGELVDRSFSGERLIATLSSGFAILAAVLAAIGLYGVMAYSLSRRTSEIGIRMALGARRSQIVWLVLRRTLRVVIAGGTIGLAAALVSTRFVSTLLYGVKPTDGLVFVGATLLLTAVALIAALVPARRASHIDPLTALRYE